MKTQPMNADAVSHLSDAEVMLMLARESLRRFGTAIPPPGAALGFDVSQTQTVPVVGQAPRKSKPVKEISPSETHRCPRCKEVKNVLSGFGTRLVKGVIRKQSYCYDCRSMSRAQRELDAEKRRLKGQRKP